LSLVLQKEDDRVRNLINLGKERGYVFYDEVNDILPTERRTSAEIGSLFSAFERHNVHVYEDAPVAKAARGVLGNTERVKFEVRENPARGEEAEIDETAHLVDKTSDPVRLYLREMGSVPLLKREGEVAIARRMERGHGLVLKTISRSPLVLKVGLSPGVRQTAKALLTVRWNCIVPRKPIRARWAPDGEAAAGSAGAHPAKE
jgi:RNA polymerase primary sigma factor